MRPHKFTKAILSILIGACVVGVSRFEALAQERETLNPVSFSRDIVPILVSQCLSCHDDASREGGYSLSNVRNLKSKGDSGLSPLIAGEACSELLIRIVTQDAQRRMPSNADALPDSTAKLFARWIAEGASIDVDETIPLEELTLENQDPFDRPEHYTQTIPISAVSFSSDAKEIAVSGYGEVLFWDLEQKCITSRLKVSGRRIADIDASRDGKYLVVSSGVPGEYGVIEIFEKNSESTWVQILVRSLRDVCLDVEFSPNGNQTLMGQFNGSVRLIDNQLLREVFILDSHAASITSVGWSEDGKKFTSAKKMPLGNLEGEEKVVQQLSVGIDGKKGRFVKVVAQNYGKLPDNHPGKGSPAWLFVDEIGID